MNIRSFIKAENLNSSFQQLAGAVGGIGITFNESHVKPDQSGSVYENSPAAKAGILTGHILYSADGNNLLGVSIEVAQKSVRGQRWIPADRRSFT